MTSFIKPCNGDITSYYGRRVHPVTQKVGVMHWGLDYGNTPYNNDIWASAPGVVTVAAYDYGYGNYIILTHSINGVMYQTLYGHLAQIKVRKGQRVNAGQTIGVKGTTGTSTGIHLHFEIHKGAWNYAFSNSQNPAIYVYEASTKEIQHRLRMLGYNIIPDGFYGYTTSECIKTFQRRNGLSVDGFAGYNTRQALWRQTPGYDKEIAKEKEEKNEQVKGEEDMSKFDAGITLNSEVKNMLELAAADGIIQSKWVKSFENRELSVAQILGLHVKVMRNRLTEFKPSSPTLNEQVIIFIERALEDGTLEDKAWLERAKSGELTDDDIAGIYATVANRSLEQERFAKEPISETIEKK